MIQVILITTIAERRPSQQDSQHIDASMHWQCQGGREDMYGLIIIWYDDHHTSSLTVKSMHCSRLPPSSTLEPKFDSKERLMSSRVDRAWSCGARWVSSWSTSWSLHFFDQRTCQPLNGRSLQLMMHMHLQACTWFVWSILTCLGRSSENRSRSSFALQWFWFFPLNKTGQLL